MSCTFHVQARWDDEAKVWFTAETNVPGLVTEAGSLEVLRQKLLIMIPDLLGDSLPGNARLHLTAETEDIIPLQAAE